MPTVAETICELTRQHLVDRKGLLFGQCIRAVGNVGGTVPDLPECLNPFEAGGVVELQTSDASNSGICCGVALAGRRPIYIIRYGGFTWINLSNIVNYASKSKAMWGISCPVFCRVLCMEGGIGPTATGAHHSMALRMPGIIVAVPMTPLEWKSVWDYYIEHDDPIYCSEHRLSFPLTDEIPDEIGIINDVVLFGISAGRLNCIKAAVELRKGNTDYKINHGLFISVAHIVWLKPLQISPEAITALKNAKFGIVVDSDYARGGTAAEHVAYELMLQTGKPVHAMGLEDRVAGFSKQTDNITPSPERIIAKVLELL